MTIEIVGILSIPKDNKLIDTIENRTAVICVLFKYSFKKTSQIQQILRERWNNQRMIVALFSHLLNK